LMFRYLVSVVSQRRIRWYRSPSTSMAGIARSKRASAWLSASQLGRDKEPMELLCKRVESRHGLACFATLPQKGMQLIHGVAITGQEITGLPCWHRGSPLA